MHLDFRYDILIKYVCILNYKNNNNSWDELTKNIYNEHLKIITSGTFREQSAEKKNINDYLQAFEKIELATRNKKLKKSSIPIDKIGSPTDGSHRIACGLINNFRLNFINSIDNSITDYQYKFFESFGFSFNAYIIESFLNNFRNARLAIIWPSNDSLTNAEDMIPNRLIRLSFDATEMQAQNIVITAYQNETWLGNFKNRYNGSLEKVYHCFKVKKPIKIIIFDSTSVNEILLKDKIRTKFGIGKHSIHITDNWEETTNSAQIFFCSNFEKWSKFTFLNSSNDFLKKLKIIENNLNSSKLNYNDILVTKGFCMELFNLRKSEDIDLMTSSKIIPEKKQFFLEFTIVPDHKIHLNYFKYFGFKFWNFNYLEKNRFEGKSKKLLHDQKLITNNSDVNRYVSKLSYWIQWQKNKSRRHMLNFLKDLGLYEIVRKFYRKFK